MATTRTTFASDFRQFFSRGLAILLPTILTLWLLWQAALFVFNNVAVPINRGIRTAVIWIVPEVVKDEQHLPQWFRVAPERVAWIQRQRAEQGLPELPVQRIRHQIRREQLADVWERWWIMEGIGLLVAIGLIYLAGRFLGGLIGRRVYSRMEGFLARVPGFKQVYPHVKQVVEMIIGDRPIAFNRVVLVEYPRRGIWTVGFVTGQSLRVIHARSGRPCLSVFVPSTPMPFTGFTITVPTDEVYDLPLTVEEAIRFFVTGGVLVPEHQSLGQGAGAGVEALPARERMPPSAEEEKE